MNDEELDALRGMVDDAALHFDESHGLVLTYERHDVADWNLTELVDGLIDVMETDSEVDDVLDLSRYFQFLAQRIQRAVIEHEQTRGEP